MICSFLTVLPREIRDQVYAYILAPTGRVVVEEDPLTKIARLSAFPRSPFNMIKFDLLSTCRQIYEESKYIYWHENLLCIEVLHEGGANPIKLLESRRRLANLLQKVEIRLWCAQNNELARAQSLVLHLSQLARHGALREVIFTISGMGTMAKFGEIVESRCGKALKTEPSTTVIVTGVYLQRQSEKADSWDRLRSLLNLFGPSSLTEESAIRDRFVGVRRKLNILLGVKHTSAAAQKGWLNDHHPDDCEETLAEMNRLLGGELYMDGILCYRDQVQVHETFRSWRNNLEIQEMISDF